MKKILFLMWLILIFVFLKQKTDSGIVAEKTSSKDRRAKLTKLIEKLDSPKYKEREQANKELEKNVTKKDIPFLEKQLKLKKFKSGEQALRLENVLISLGWISKQNKKRLDNLIKNLFGPDKIDVLTEILSVPNGEAYLKKYLSTKSAGEISLKIIGDYNINIDIINASAHSFYFYNNPLLRIESSRKRELAFLGIPQQGLFRGSFFTNFRQFVYLKPGTKLNFEYKINRKKFQLNPGKIRLFFENFQRTVRIIKYNIYNSAVLFSTRIKFPVWTGRIEKIWDGRWK